MKVVSLFSGAGGLDLGFVQSGHTIVWANDFDPDCCATYSKNIGKHIVCGDISLIDKKQIPDCDIVIGGFPCQGFSCANLKRSSDDKRNFLYLEFVNVLKTKKPLYFLAENVRGLLSLEKGLVFKMILQDFEEIGYHVDYRLLLAADFGVPQNRWRVFIIGVRSDVSVKCEFEFPKATHCNPVKNINGLKPWVTISEALNGYPEPSDDHSLLNHVCSQYKITNRNFTGHRSTNPNSISPTILARGNGKGGVCALQHFNNHRRLSVRESATIQTFPLNYEFYGSLNSMYRQVGNAVPVLLAKVISSQFPRLVE